MTRPSNEESEGGCPFCPALLKTSRIRGLDRAALFA